MPRKKRIRAPRGTKPPKVTPLPSGRWRAQIFDPLANEGNGAYVGVCDVIGIPAQTFGAEREAWRQVERAADLLAQVGRGTTIAQIRERWLARKKDARGRVLKESTQISNAERTLRLKEKFGNEVPHAIEDKLLAYGRERMYPAQREACKAMFNFAVDEQLLGQSPLRKLKTEKGKGNTEVFPPRDHDLNRLFESGRQICPPLADWIEFGSLVGTRPGETDALRLSDFNADFTRVRILRQFNVKTGRITEPKAVHTHEIAVPPRAREIVKACAFLRGPDDYVFTNVRGRDHWTPSSRAYHWNAVMAAAGFRRRGADGKLRSDFTPYLATRHYCGWFLVNVKQRTSEEVAHQLRHDDGGELVRKLYGKRDRTMAIDVIALCQEDDEEAMAA